MGNCNLSKSVELVRGARAIGVSKRSRNWTRCDWANRFVRSCAELASWKRTVFAGIFAASNWGKHSCVYTNPMTRAVCKENISNGWTLAYCVCGMVDFVQISGWLSNFGSLLYPIHSWIRMEFTVPLGKGTRPKAYVVARCPCVCKCTCVPVWMFVCLCVCVYE